MAFAYERGWCDSFKCVGFLGLDEEVWLVVDVFGEFVKGGIVVDVLCGSGLFTRRFLKTYKGRLKAYKGVVVFDYFDVML